jgi:CubicO group peptidase (beta-lactamase class C family)
MEVVAPETVGLSSVRLERLKAKMQGFVDDQKIAGAITMIARKGRIAHFETFGYADIQQQKKMTEDEIFRIYSMTKPIISVALMSLYEEGMFQLNDPVSRYIPAIAEVKVYSEEGDSGKLDTQVQPIRIVDLLRHSSGFGYGWGTGDHVDSAYARAELFEAKTLKEFVDKAFDLPLYFQPGTKWRYGISADISGYLIEVLSGQPLDEFLAERIFRPLNMHDTGFGVPKKKAKRFATYYKPTDEGGLEVREQASTSAWVGNETLFLGGGGLVSTTADYLNFAQMMLNQGELNGTRILSRKTVELMTRNQVADIPNGGGSVMLPNRGEGFGLGFQVTTDIAVSERLSTEGAYGWSGIAGTYFHIDPQEELILILMIQLFPHNQHQIDHYFHTLAYQSIID